MSAFKIIWYFLYHRFTARKWDSFHSPYLFKLFTYCCDDRNEFPVFKDLENERADLLHSKEKIKRTDYGAGPSNSSSSSEKFISNLAAESLSRPFQCRFLYRLMKITHAVTIVEFGTSLGIASAYLAKAGPDTKIITIEVDPVIASIARKLFNNQGINNIKIINSTFEDFFNSELSEIQSLDFLFLDGNHKGERLIFYYQSLLPYFTERSIIMVDDIYWSEDMNDGWTKLIDMPEVTQSVDCFQFGMLFFSRDFIHKEHHKIRLPLKAFKRANSLTRKQVWHT